MADNAKLFTIQISTTAGVPYGLCFVQAFDSTGAARKAIWTDRAKTLPSVAGSLLNLDGDTSGRVSFYGDGVYRLIFRAAGDDGTNSPILVLENVQIVDAEEAYDGPTASFTIESHEESNLSGQGRQAASTSAQSGTTLNLALFDADGATYLVPGTASLLTFQYVSIEGYADGARITLECITNPFRLRAKRAADSSATYNLSIGRDFYMPVGSSVDLELRSSVWYERSRVVAGVAYDQFEGTGVASAASLVLPGADTVLITGTVTITNIYWILTGEVAPPGTKVDLRFSGATTVTDGGNIALDGDLVTANGTILGLVSIGTAGWQERFRKPTGASVVTLGSGATPSIKGTGAGDVNTVGVLVTGNNDLVAVTRLTDPVKGKVITIVNDNTLGSADLTYVSLRKIFQHAASASAGYLSLEFGADFAMVLGETLTLVCLEDSSAVLYWKETARQENSTIWPEIEVTGLTTFAPWRPYHTLVDAGTATIATMTPYGRASNRIFRFRGKTGISNTTFTPDAAPTAGEIMMSGGGNGNLGNDFETLAFFLHENFVGTKYWVSLNVSGS